MQTPYKIPERTISASNNNAALYLPLDRKDDKGWHNDLAAAQDQSITNALNTPSTQQQVPAQTMLGCLGICSERAFGRQASLFKRDTTI